MFLGSFLWLRGRNESHFSRGKWLWIPEKPLAGRVRGGGRGRGVLLSQRGAAGSFEDVCPAHSFTSQQLGRPGVGMTGTQGPAQEKGGVGAKLDGCSPSPQTGFSRAKWGSRKAPPPPPPQALGDLGRLEKYVHLGVPMYVCGPLTALKREGLCVHECVSSHVCFSLNSHQQEGGPKG